MLVLINIVRKEERMKKEFIINIDEYILLEIVRMLDYFSYDEIITEKLREIEKIINKRIFSNFFRGEYYIKILQEDFVLRYLYEADK